MSYHQQTSFHCAEQSHSVETCSCRFAPRTFSVLSRKSSRRIVKRNGQIT